MLEIFYKYFDKFCGIDKFEQLKLDTDYFYPALAEKDFTDCFRPRGKQNGSDCNAETLRTVPQQMKQEISSPEFVARNTTNMTRQSRVSSKKNSGAQECCVFVVKLTAATILSLINWSSPEISKYNSKILVFLWISVAEFLTIFTTEVFGQKITPLQRMSKLIANYFVFFSQDYCWGGQNSHTFSELVCLTFYQIYFVLCLFLHYNLNNFIIGSFAFCFIITHVIYASNDFTCFLAFYSQIFDVTGQL